MVRPTRVGSCQQLWTVQTGVRLRAGRSTSAVEAVVRRQHGWRCWQNKSRASPNPTRGRWLRLKVSVEPTFLAGGRGRMTLITPTPNAPAFLLSRTLRSANSCVGTISDAMDLSITRASGISVDTRSPGISMCTAGMTVPTGSHLVCWFRDGSNQDAPGASIQGSVRGGSACLC